MQLLLVASSVVRRWWLVLPLALVGLLAAYFWNTSQPIRYESTVTLQLNPAASGGLLPFQTDGSRQTNEVTALGAAYSELVRSQAFGELVVQQLGLLMSPDAVAMATRARLVPNTNLLRLTVTMDTPRETQELAQGIAEVFIAENAKRQQVTPAQARLLELERLLTLYREQLDLLRVRQDDLNRAVAAGDSSKNAELLALEGRVSTVESTYTNLVLEVSRVRGTFQNAILLDRATAPRSAWPPPLYQSLVIGLLFAGGVGVALAMFLEQLDSRLRLPEQVALLLDGNPIGTVGRISTRRWPPEARASRLAMLHATRSPGAEAFRTLRTSLRFAAPDQSLRSLFVTSPGPGEGKTFVASNLATAFAQAGRRVLLVDADLRRPNIHGVFGLSQAPGLMDLLLRHLDAPSGATPSSILAVECVRPASVPNLWILTAGPLPKNPDLVLGSEAIGQVIADLEQRWDLVIVDSAPLGPVADSLLLAAHLDGALLVARANQTRRADLQRALEALGQTTCPVLGIVLNHLQLGLIDRYTTGSYYTYGRKYYGQVDDESEPRDGHVAVPEAALAKGRAERPER